ncbi:putative TdLSC37 protein [Hordeum vulgare]|nr:putative TdLSC37 protein [Hordeum vulgare]
MVMGYPPAAAQSIADRLNCQVGSFPTAYLGYPSATTASQWRSCGLRLPSLQHRIEPWQGRWLSKVARTVLINSYLSSLLLFLMSFYSLPETLHHEIATVQARFFWARDGDKQKYHMVRWSEICKPHDQGGLGIMSSKRMNIALLARWLWRISRGEGGLWLRIIQNKYLRGQPLACCHWSGDLSSGSPSSNCSRFSALGPSVDVGSGTSTLFWFDCWASSLPFAARFLGLFSIAVMRGYRWRWPSMASGALPFDALSGRLTRLPGRRCWTPSPFTPQTWTAPTTASLGVWSHQSASLRNPFTRNCAFPGFTPLAALWETRLPLKIQIFLWQWLRGRLPSGVEVLKRNGPWEAPAGHRISDNASLELQRNNDGATNGDCCGEVGWSRKREACTIMAGGRAVKKEIRKGKREEEERLEEDVCRAE